MPSRIDASSCTARGTSQKGDVMSDRPGTDEFEQLVGSALRSVVSEAAVAENGRLYRSVMARVELPLLRQALELAGGNQLKAARMLGINRNTLRKRLRLLGLLPSSGGNGAQLTGRAGSGAADHHPVTEG